MKRKSQIEIIGLVVIVLIISLAMVFGITLKVRSQTTPRSSYANDQLATNFLLAMLKTDQTLCNLRMRELISYCASKISISCSDGNDACYHANITLGYMINETLGIMQSKYLLRVIKLPGNEELFRFEKDCGLNQPKGMQGYQPMTLYPTGRVDMMLDICR